MSENHRLNAHMVLNSKKTLPFGHYIAIMYMY